MRITKLTPTLARIAWAGIFGFAGLMVIATAVQPESYRWPRDFISGLAAMDAAYPAIMIAGFQFGAVGILATAVLTAGRYRRVSGVISAGLLAVAGVALSVAGFARFDCSRNDAACQAQLDAGMSWHSQLHGQAALLVFLPLILTPFVLAVALLRDRDPDSGRRRGWWGAAAVLVGLADLFVIVAVEEQLTPVTGLLQRVAVLTLLGFPLLVAAGTRWPSFTRAAAQPA